MQISFCNIQLDVRSEPFTDFMGNQLGHSILNGPRVGNRLVKKSGKNILLLYMKKEVGCQTCWCLSLKFAEVWAVEFLAPLAS